MLTIHFRITDSQANRPTPARISITGPNGQVFAPLGRFTEFPAGIDEAVGAGLWFAPEKWFPIDGGCEIKLPAGVPLRFRVTKGPEYVPLDQTLTLGTGQMAVRLALTHWTNPMTTGWHSGDGRGQFLSPHAALLEAGAEGLGVVNLLSTEQLVPGQDGHLYPTATHLDAFGGQTPTLQTDDRLVVVNTLNTHPALGKVALLHSHRPIFPLAFGEESDDWSIIDWCRQCHRKKGLTVWCDPFKPGATLQGGEALVALILGEIDSYEFGPQPQVQQYYRLLEAGFVAPIVGSSGKQTNKVPLGAMRTYARAGVSPLPTGERAAERSEPGEGQPTTAPHPALRPPFARRGVGMSIASGSGQFFAWIEAVRAGRTYATSGPRVECTVNGKGPGEAVDLTTAGMIEVHATAESVVPFDRLELVCNSEVAASADASCFLPPCGGGLGWGVEPPGMLTPTLTLPHQGGGNKADSRFSASIVQTVPLPSSSWLAVRCVGPMGSILYPAAPTFAHTSPVVVKVGDAPLPRKPAAVAFLQSCIEKVKDWATTAGRYTEPKWQTQLLARCDEAAARLTS